MAIKNTRAAILLFLGVLLTFTSCKNEESNNNEPMITDNLLLQEFTGPYGGVPAFDKMKVEDVKDAMEIGMEMSLKDIDAIGNNADAPTFENTIEAMERSGQELDRAFRYYGIFSNLCRRSRSDERSWRGD